VGSGAGYAKILDVSGHQYARIKRKEKYIQADLSGHPGRKPILVR
jgi:hypothetical protein